MSDFLTVFIAFLLIHLIGDFYLQPGRWRAAKHKSTYRAPQLYIHALLQGIALSVPAMVLGMDWRTTACLIAIVAVIHVLIDLWQATRNPHQFTHMVAEQALHTVVFALLAFYITTDITISTMLQHDKFAQGMLVALAYVLVLKPTSVGIGSLLNKYSMTVTDNHPQMNGLVAGGELIGYLERILILTFTLVGSYAAVGFVFTAKSIFRFGELNKSDSRNLTEYVLIGSLLSVVIATLVGTLVSLGLDIKISISK
ncbi:DUF3307 domain-containing protein [Vibrio sp. MEBiC08052]|uniref:DUF3307 domain-containing protein n=1 Tax=Vibrio sp. MEBiC08052 TaxID=1761910 RepID=UPI0007405B3E|nr:DUF3307 domain-containing protein [Vibrio sp. MEBiC08052]KUI97406.1 hypothetical protein VRK_35950 [Vibrio sp. MEBiC08052]